MIKRILIIVTFFWLQNSFSQQTTASPYSYFGLGTLKFRGTHDAIAAGGSLMLTDSVQVNVLNPATYSGQLLTSIQVGLSMNYNRFKSFDLKEKAQRASFDYVILAIPATKKLGFTLGVVPETNVGYRIVNDKRETTGVFKRYEGEGGVNKVFFGSGYQINQNFSFGLNVNYLFGTLESETFYSDSNILDATKEFNSSSLSGFSFDFGLNYKKKILKKYNLTSSFVFSPEAKINSRSSSLIATVTNSSQESIISTLPTTSFNTEFVEPSKMAFGLGLGKRNWFVGADFTARGTENLVNRVQTATNVSYENSNRVSVGGFFIPNIDSYNNYFSRVTYRAGFRYENTGMLINNEQIKDQALSFGFGFPISNGFSAINISGEWGNRGTTKSGLVLEHYFNVGVGIVFKDKWFKRRLID
jgi:hypothetical protein